MSSKLGMYKQQRSLLGISMQLWS